MKEITDQLINTLLDAIKAEHGLTSDSALARHLTQASGITVHEMYITRWRRGEYGRTAMPVLANELVRYGKRTAEGQVEQAA